MTIETPWFAHYEKGVPQTVDVPNKLLQDLVTDAASASPTTPRCAWSSSICRWACRSARA